MGTVTCITGIDTDIGKTVATGILARSLLENGCRVITQKVVQTGCSGIAEDIVRHREIMGIDLVIEDQEMLTCSHVYQKACSPHLAAELEGRPIDIDRISRESDELSGKYDHVLLEGAGGLLVPLTRKLSFLDYVESRGYHLILVSSPRLGSINHTLSALELAGRRGVYVRGIVYNLFGKSDPEIRNDSRQIFLGAQEQYGFPPNIVDLVDIGGESINQRAEFLRLVV